MTSSLEGVNGAGPGRKVSDELGIGQTHIVSHKCSAPLNFKGTAPSHLEVQVSDLSDLTYLQSGTMSFGVRSKKTQQ